MKKRHTLIKSVLFIGCVLYPFLSYGKYDSDNGIYTDVATRYFPFLKREYDARAIGMGGASTGMPNSIYGLLSNPAAIGYLNRSEAMISYVPVVLDVNGGTIAYAMPYKTFGVFAANILYLSYGTFEPLDEVGNKIEGALHPFSIAGSLSWSKIILENLSAGVTVKGIYERLSEGIGEEIDKYSADGFAADIGIQYRTLSTRLIYGLLIRNIGFLRSGYSDDIDNEGLPVSVLAGFSYVFKNFPTIRTAFDLEKPVDDFLKYKIGLELNMYKQVLLLRGGFNFSQRDMEEFFSMIRNGSFDADYNKSDWSLFSLGLGLKTELRDFNVNFDAAVRFRVERTMPCLAFTLLLGF